MTAPTPLTADDIRAIVVSLLSNVGPHTEAELADIIDMPTFDVRRELTALRILGTIEKVEVAQGSEKWFVLRPLPTGASEP